jgi:hypothetical protein
MSAYLCDSDHISAVVNAGRLTYMRDSSTLVAYLTPESSRTVYELNTPQEALYSDLLQTNLDSLAERYPDSPKISDWTDDEGAYRYDEKHKFPSVVAAIKGVQCYQYQSCEHDGWQTSGAKRYTDALISSLIAVLPGYETAAWGFAGVEG